MSESVGNYFRTLRQRRGLSQETIARAVDVSTRQLYNWERGTHVPSAQSLVLLLRLLKGSFKDISTLVLDSGATADDGIKLAEQRLLSLENPGETPDEGVEEQAFPEPDLAEAMHLLESVYYKQPDVFQNVIGLLRVVKK